MPPPQGRPGAGSPLVLDTDVFSYLFKADTRAGAYRPHLEERLLVLSFMTVAELEAWAEIHRWGQRTRARLEQVLAGYVIHFPDRSLCRLWGRIIAAARARGKPIGPADAWIAATALLYDVPLVTHNPTDFAAVPGLQVLTDTAR